MTQVGPGRLRKVALLGGAKDTLRLAPWSDPSWELWAHNSIPPRSLKRTPDRFFDLHPPNCFQESAKCGRTDYYGWLKSLRVPVYMQQAYPEIPASVRYPREQVQTEWPLAPFGSQTAWMIALALREGVTHLGLYGIHYAFETEYEDQRANCELWVGIAMGRGVQVFIPPGCPVAREPKDLYGYESHTPEKYAQRLAKFKTAAAKRTQTNVPGLKTAKPGFDPRKLVQGDEAFTDFYRRLATQHEGVPV